MYSIGVITSEYSLHNIMRVDTKMRERCKITYLPYSSMEHLLFLYRENAAYFDGLLFSGSFPYHIILEQLGEITRPAAYFTISDRDYFKTIAKIAVGRREIDFSRVFIDGPEIEVDFQSVFPRDKMPIIGGEDDAALSFWESYKPLKDFYQSLWESGRVDLIVTRYSSLKDFFAERHIRHELLLASRESMMETFQALLMRISSEQIHDSATCVGIISIAEAEYSRERQVRLMEELKTCNKRLGSLFLFYERERCAELMTNLSALKELTQYYTVCPVCAHLGAALPFSVSIGWGCAAGVMDAHRNAQRARKKAASHKGTSSYIATSDHILIGPLASSHKRHAGESGAEWVSRICGQSGLSFSTVNRR